METRLLDQVERQAAAYLPAFCEPHEPLPDLMAPLIAAAKTCRISGVISTAVPRPAIGEEVPMKAFIALEAQQYDVCVGTIFRKIQRGDYDGIIVLRRVNQRVVFVKRLNDRKPKYL